MEDEDVQLEDSNLDETLDSNQENEEFDEGNDELTKAQEIARNQKIRAEKAEAELKKLKQSEPAEVEKETPKNNDLSTDDLYSLMEAKVSKEDIPEVKEAAKVLGITITEALNRPLIKNMLKEKAEERATANATSTATSKRGTRKDSDEAILEKARQGKVTEDDIDRLVQAEMNAKRALNKQEQGN